LFIIPAIGVLLAILGWILILVAVDNISGVVGDKSIFRDTLIAAVLAIVGIAVGALVVLASVLRFTNLNGLTLITGPNSLRSLNATAFRSGTLAGVGALVAGALVGLLLIWIFFLVSAIFLRRGFTKVGTKLNVKMFETASLVYLIGAGLAIVGVGFIIIFVADILMVVAFFSMPDDQSLEPPPRPMGIPPPPPPVSPA